MRHDCDGAEGAPGHPELKGFGADGRIVFWPRRGSPAPQTFHVGFEAHSEAEKRAAHAAALAAGAEEIPTRPQLHSDPRYNAAQLRDPDGDCLELVFKSWQHAR